MAGDEGQHREADVDEEVGAAASDEEDADGWHWRVLVGEDAGGGRVGKRTEDCDEDEEESFDHLGREEEVCFGSSWLAGWLVGYCVRVFVTTVLFFSLGKLFENRGVLSQDI